MENVDAGYALVVGESLIDIVRAPGRQTREHPGGSAANAAVALSRLGRAVWFATSFGDDERGGVLAGHLEGNGVRFAGDPHVVPRTATALATLRADGAAEYEFDIAWHPSDCSRTPSGPPEVIMCGSIGAVLGDGAGEVVALLDEHAGRTTVSYDVNARPAITGSGDEVREQVLGVARRAAIVKASDEDLEALWPGDSLEQSAGRFLDGGSAAVLVTRGGDGAVWFGTAGSVEVAGEQVQVADTIGAGDTFGAAAVDALWERGLLGADGPALLRAADATVWREVLAFAARAAAVTVSRPGADPPRRDELG